MKLTTLFVALAATSAMTVANAQGGDDCAAPTVIAGQGGFALDSSAASTGTEGQNEALCYFFGNSGLDNDVWYSWTADVTGSATLNTCGAALDSKLAAYPGGGCPTAGSSIACNDDSCGLQSEVMLAVTSGTSYMLQVGSFPGASGGTGTLNISIAAAANPDDCATPDVIAGQGLFAFDQTLATTGAEGQNEALCLFFGQSAVDNDVWFSWTADIDGTANVQTCAQTTTDTKLAVYPGGGCPTAGSSLACNDDNCALQSQVTFPVTAGTSYMIQVGTFPGSSGGTGNLDISILPPTPPAEDDCATPATIAGQGNFAWNTLLASTGAEGQNEALCYAFGSSAIDNDVWFSWTADASGTALVSTCNNTNVDTKIAAYPGGGCPTTGSSLACNDDTCGLLSQISFACTSGTSYMLQIGNFPGASGGTGSIDISITGGATNDDCATPDAIAGQGSFAYDNSNASTGVEGQNDALCYAFGSSAIDNDVWFSWTADADGLAVVATCSSTADTKIAAYDGSGCPAGPALACNDDTCGLQSEIVFPVVSGTVYTLQLGNFPGASGASGSFDIFIAPPTGIPYCFCDGSLFTLPCTALGVTGNGCGNSGFAEGVHLTGSGLPIVGADSVVLSATGIPSGQTGLFFQGNNAFPLPFGDGILCTVGQLVRLGTVTETGNSMDTSGLALPISVKGGVAPGDLRFYQLWYRDPAGTSCGSGFNTSNGFAIQW